MRSTREAGRASFEFNGAWPPRGYRKRSVHEMTISAENPYEAPASVNSELAVADGHSYAWHGRSFTVATSASGAILWLFNVITVSIDDLEVHRQRAVHSGQNFLFTFEHNGRMVDAQVRLDRAFTTHLIKYELIVDGETVAKSQVSIDNWMRGIVVMLALLLIIFGWLSSVLISQ